MKFAMSTSYNKSSEQGFASIVIALTLVLIMALLTVGFAQLTRREQQNALKKQLSVQAYYASESGINDAVDDILANKITTSNATCTPTPATGVGTNYNLYSKYINSTLGVSYSCVSIDLNPTSLQYTNVSDGSFRTITFSSAGATSIKTLTVSWSSADGQNTPPVSNVGFKTQSRWTSDKYPAVMEVSLTPLTTLTRQALTDSDFTTYGYPVTSASTPIFYGSSTSVQEGKINNAQCVAGTCSMVIDVSSLNTTGPFLLHLTDHYDKSTITITGSDGTSPVKFQGGQAVIDSTGRARDVVKRLQVHIPLNAAGVLPNYAIEAGNVCKRITTYPNAGGGSSTDAFHLSTNGLGADATGSNPCNLD